MSAGRVHRIRIAARLRPRLEGEPIDEGIKVVHLGDESGEVAADDSNASMNNSTGGFVVVENIRDHSKSHRFGFSSVYDQNSTQAEVFHNDVLPLVDVAFSGATVTIFAYGVTSSGKTHTMQGTRQQPGVIPRVVQALFERKAATPHSQIDISLSYMELYKEDVYDLLVDRDSAPKLPVREDGNGKVFVSGLTKVSLQSAKDFDALYESATSQRSVGATNLNRASSRSHAILTLEVEIVDKDAGRRLTGKMNLVDLAGSENNKLTGNDPARMAESSAINKSLSVLGQVVRALNKHESRIPYRNSKLTRILQDALGGSSLGLLICNIAPGVKWRSDTLNTLNFASKAKEVENRVTVNEQDLKPARTQFSSRPSMNIELRRNSVLQPIPSVNSNNIGVNGIPSRVPRQSLVPVPKPRFSRTSGVGSGPAKENTTSSANPGVPRLNSGISDKEINDRIAKAVEMEVTRRLAEREKELELSREKEREASLTMERPHSAQGYPSPGSTSNSRRKSGSRSRSNSTATSPRRAKENEAVALPPGILTPYLKRQREMDEELKARLRELEAQYERGAKETQLADVLSPVSRKKAGRAYVALARTHSEKGNLRVALDLYRKAETYVPDNIKLKERIIEIEWAVKNDKPFVPSPKKPRKVKNKKKHRLQEEGLGPGLIGPLGVPEVDHDRDAQEDQMDVDGVLGMVVDEDPYSNNSGCQTRSALKRERETSDAEDDSAPGSTATAKRAKIVLESFNERGYEQPATPRKHKEDKIVLEV